MNKYDRPKFEKVDLGENPFLTKLEIKVNTIKSSDKYKVFNKDAGEDAIFEYAHYEYEAEKYCKVFTTAEKRLHMVQFSPRIKDLLLWIIYEVKSGEDYIWLNKLRYMEENSIGSINTYKTALNELVKKRYLGKTVVSDVYWINPDFIYNGNRIKSFPDNVIRK